MRKNLLKDKRAVSAVIATVIIVAVTIAVAIAVAYWMGGLATVFTRFEKIEVKSAYVVKLIGPPQKYVVTLNFINTGATATSIDSVILNGVPIPDWTPMPVLELDGDPALVLPLTCETGVSHDCTITFPLATEDKSGNQLNPGVTLTVTIHSSYGKDYHSSVTLP